MLDSVISISLLTPADVPGAVEAIQLAFAADPYNLWVYNDRSKVSGCISSFGTKRSPHNCGNNVEIWLW